MRTAIAIVLSLAVAAAAINTRPIIGILTLPCDDPTDCGKHTEYFPASYVKSVEAGGARVVPVHYTSSPAEMTALMGNLNGMLFTGGGASLDNNSPFYHAIQTVYKYVTDTNAGGDYFPLWGTCQGFEAICRAASNDPNILTSFDAENYTIPLAFTPLAEDSRMFDSASAPYVMSLLSTYNVTMNNHQFGVSPSDFAASPNLNDGFNVLSTNVDRNGRTFVSLIEGKSMPIYAAQFHSEKPQWEWWPDEVIQHTHESVVANGYFMQFFVNECRSSAHSFPGDDSTIDFIYRYNAAFTDDEFTQQYFW